MALGGLLCPPQNTVRFTLRPKLHRCHKKTRAYPHCLQLILEQAFFALAKDACSTVNGNKIIDANSIFLSFEPNNPIKISKSTIGLNVSFTTTGIGLAVDGGEQLNGQDCPGNQDPENNNDENICKFSAGPPRPSFTPIQ